MEAEDLKQLEETLNELTIDLDKLDELMLRAIEQGNGIIVEAVQDQKVVSACFFLLYSNTITYLKGASDEFGKELGAMHLIFDSLIEEYISDL